MCVCAADTLWAHTLTEKQKTGINMGSMCDGNAQRVMYVLY